MSLPTSEFDENSIKIILNETMILPWSDQLKMQLSPQGNEEFFLGIMIIRANFWTMIRNCGAQRYV
jgi:hypothetical protein